VLIDGPVQGSVWVSAGQVQLGPNARVAGAVHWRSDKELQRDPAAQVAGELDHMAPLVTRRVGGRDDDSMPMHSANWGGRSHSPLTGGWLWNLGLMLLAALLVAAWPDSQQRLSTTLRTRWPASLLTGFVVLVCVPMAALLLLLTLIGAPLAVVVMLLYPPLLIVGYVSFAAALGQWALRRWHADVAAQIKWRVAVAMLAVFALAALASLPLLGWLLALVAVFTGVGLIALQWQRGTAAAVVKMG
jgi:hypothetical protein